MNSIVLNLWLMAACLVIAIILLIIVAKTGVACLANHFWWALVFAWAGAFMFHTGLLVTHHHHFFPVFVGLMTMIVGVILAAIFLALFIFSFVADHLDRVEKNKIENSLKED